MKGRYGARCRKMSAAASRAATTLMPARYRASQRYGMLSALMQYAAFARDEGRKISAPKTSARADERAAEPADDAASCC